MTTTTKPTPIVYISPLLQPALPRFRPGQLVVLTAEQPLVCVVLEETFGGLLRLSRAACPEDHLVMRASEVQHLATWLMTQLAHGEPAATGKA
jgi:hypothetical protein